MNAGTIVTFILYLAAMIGIGVVCYYRTSSHSDYILGGRGLGPGVAALSAGASDMSGWLLLGLPGAIYASGMNQMWIAVGLVIGAYLNWQFIARRLRIYTEVARDALTIPDYFDNRFRDGSKVLRIISAVVILLFFTFYISAGLVGGGVLFEQTFGLNYQIALWTGAVVIVSYVFLGGFLAVCWTDFVQGIMMFIALLVVPIVAIIAMGGWDTAVSGAAAANPTYNDALAGMSAFGIVSLMAWGLGYFGQPHILARFMAVRTSNDIPAARFICMTWMVLGLYGAVFTGYAGIAYFADQPLSNPETVFIAFCQAFFNPWIAGFLLAAILAAIMSTISSQLIVCSSVIAEDFYRGLIRKDASDRELVLLGRMSVIGVSLVAILFALDPQSRILDLVAYAWAGFGAAFGPVVLLSLFWRRMTRNGAAAGLIVGAITVVVWKQLYAFGGIFEMYEIVPGFLLATLAIIGVSLLGREPEAAVLADFDRALEADVTGVVAQPAE